MDNVSNAALIAALESIATFFQENVTTYEGGTRNTLSYPQEKMLNGICYAVVNQIAYTTEQQLEPAKRELAQALADFQGNEISINQVERKMKRVEGTNYQLAHLEAFKEAALEVYQRHAAKPYEHRSKGSKTAVTSDSLLAQAAALAGIKVPAGATDKESTLATNNDAQTARKAAKR